MLYNIFDFNSPRPYCLDELNLFLCACPVQLGSSWILSSQQPHRVTSGQITQSELFYTGSKNPVTESEANSWIPARDENQTILSSKVRREFGEEKREKGKKVKVKGPGIRLGEKREQEIHSWQWAKHPWLYYDLLQVLKGEKKSVLGFQQWGS